MMLDERELERVIARSPQVKPPRIGPWIALENRLIEQNVIDRHFVY